MNPSTRAPLLSPVLTAFVLFFIFGARDPARHLGLIWFTVWSSVAHATVMAIHSITDPGQMGHLWGDVAALYLTAIVLAVLVRRDLPGARLTQASTA